MKNELTGAFRRTGLATLALCATTVLCASGRDVTPFTPNLGQWNAPFAFRSQSGNLAVFLERDALTWSMLQPDFDEVIHESFHDHSEPMLSGHAWRVHFEGAQVKELVPSGASKSYTSYFLGNDRSRWQSRVHSYAEVMYEQLWAGVDMRFHMQEGSFKYDMLLAPNADVAIISMRYEGLDGMAIDADGDLVLRTSLGDLQELRPVAWYADGAQEKIDCRYVLNGDRVGFEFRNTDRTRPITIDPVLVASTLSGTGDIGQTQNYGHTATYDDQGNIYTGAICFGQGYPVTTGAFQSIYGNGGTDYGISKLNTDGSNLIWASYIGGNGTDHPHSMIVDNSGSLWVYGSTTSTDFPTTTGAVDGTLGGTSDIAVSRFDPTGSTLLGSTLMGGSDADGNNQMTSNYGDYYRGEIIVDNANNAYVSSCSNSTDFPTTAGAYQTTYGGQQDGVVFSLNPTCSNLLWSTYLGTANNEMCFGLKLGNDGSVFVGGGTESAAFPTTSGSFQPASQGGYHDAFVSNLSNNGSTLTASTYWGTSGDEVAFFLQTDLAGNVYIYGQGDSGTIPVDPPGTYNNANGDIFVVKFTPDLATKVFSSSIGVSGGFGSSVVPVAFLVDVCDKIYISGYSAQAGLDVTANALYTSGGFYFAVYEENMTSLLYGTYYNGANHVDGGTSRFDKNGIVYQAVCTGGGFPTTPWAWSSTQPPGWDIGVFKIDFQQAGVQTYSNASATAGCAPAPITFTGTGNAVTWIWDFGDGSALGNTQNPSHTYTDPGMYNVMLIGIDSSTCNIADTTYLPIFIGGPGSLEPGFVAQQTADCQQIEVVATDTTIGSYYTTSWNMGDGSPILSGLSITHVYAGPGNYTITLTVVDTLCGDTAFATLPINLTQGLNYDLGPDEVICPDGSVVLDATYPGATYVWSTNATTASITVDTPDDYWVTIDVQGCTATDTVNVSLTPEPGDLNSSALSCPGDIISLSIPLNGTYLWGTGQTTQSISVDEFGDYPFIVTDQYGCTYDGVASSVSNPNDFQVWVPNVFSPNNDGENDRFEPQTGGPRDVEVTIYNRWGMEMFHSDDLSTLWDGKHDTNKVPDGTYYYIVKYKPACQAERVTDVGHVTVLR